MELQFISQNVGYGYFEIWSKVPNSKTDKKQFVHVN